MAVQIDPPGQIQEFLGILRRRKWQILLPTLFLLSLGLAFAVIVPKKFLVETQVELRSQFTAGDSRANIKERTLGVAQNASQQIRSMRRITEVIENLNWADYLTLGRRDQVEYRLRVRDNIRVSVPDKGRDVGSSFVSIEYRDVNRDRAQVFLKALRQAWIEQVVERDRTRVDIEYTTLLNRKGELEKEWHRESQRLSDLRIDHEISPTQPTPGQHQQRFEDPAIERFEGNKARLETVALTLDVALASLELRREQLAELAPEVPETAISGGRDHAAEIEALVEEREILEEDLEGIKPAHSRYRTTQAKLLALGQSIAELEGQESEGLTSVEFVPNPDYQALLRQVTSFEGDVLSLETEHASLQDLIGRDRDEMRSLAEAYREDSERSARITILTTTLGEIELQLQQKKQMRGVLYGPSGNPFQILQDVEPPTNPTEPNPILIVLLAAILGLGLGLGSALTAEFSRSCFRTTADVSRVLVVPVLGVISPIVTSIQRRRRGLRRATVGASSLALIGVVCFVTWAWKFEPDLLGQELLASIDDLRSLFL
ncbi:MAG: hypothetical protein ABGY71_00835 [bacterium]|nr:hypothetical protein [Planctomycetota bacterium]HIL53359.1 hypothetical protein [Planctomycetota bacterium]